MRSSTSGTLFKTRSNVSGDPTLTILPATSQRLLEAARHVLATPGLPPVVEILATAHHSEQHPLLVDNVKVDLIPTSPIVDGDLDGFEDDDLLFLAGHRWAFEGAEPARLSTAGSHPLDIDVATTAGLVAAKSHAVGYPRSGRRATKHGSDLLDLVRLVDLYNGGLMSALRASLLRSRARSLLNELVMA